MVCMARFWMHAHLGATIFSLMRLSVITHEHEVYFLDVGLFDMNFLIRYFFDVRLSGFLPA